MTRQQTRFLLIRLAAMTALLTACHFIVAAAFDFGPFHIHGVLIFALAWVYPIGAIIDHTQLRAIEQEAQ